MNRCKFDIPWQQFAVRPGVKWMLQAAGPLLVMLGLGFAIATSQSPRETDRSSREKESDRSAGKDPPPSASTNPSAPPAPSEPQPPSAPRAPSAAKAAPALVDFSALRPGDTVPDWNVSQGNFRLVSREDRTVLELSHEPMAEGRLVWSRILKSHGAIRSRMWGERTRRSTPRFALGVAGSTSAYWFRAVPSEKALQFVGPEEKVLTSIPWAWDEEKPLWLELDVLPSTEGPGSTLEGRVWAEGRARPDAPSLVLAIPVDLGFARALVAAAPYALKPVYLDHLEVVAP